MEKVKLGDYVKIRTGKLDANASSPNGEYSFFTCSRIPLKIDKYSYDCECVLVAGNGDLNVKYYNGKFDAYQRTYIIESLDKKKLDTRYLYCFMNKYIEKLRKQTIGGIIKYIKLENLTNIQILLPSVPEQERIAGELDVVCGAMEKQKKQLELCDTLIKSKFNEMFGNLKQNSRYDTKKLMEVSTIISGGTPSRQVPEYWKGNINWVKTTELKNDKILKTEEFITINGLNNSSAKICPIGTILIAMYGQGKTRGMTAMLNIEAATNQACACIIPKIDINPDFLWIVLKMSYDALRSFAKGAGQPNLNLDIIKNYKIPLPPLPLQQKFADFVNKVEQNKAKINKSLNETKTLYKALMQKYFDKEEV